MPMRQIAGALAGALAVGAVLSPAAAQQARARRAAPAVQSAPLRNVRYEVTFDSATAARRTLRVTMQFDAQGSQPVLLSLPAWTPGAYEITSFARWVSGFTAVSGTDTLDWDKLDPDTWRIATGGARPVTVSFDYLADTLDNAMAWSRPDFAFFNGTNVFPYPEGRGTDFAATVTVRTQPGWVVATGMSDRPGEQVYGESDYHDLVDKPFLVGRIDLDSMQVAGKWTRLATYPAGQVDGEARAAIWREIEAMIPAMGRVWNEVPWQDYTVMMVFDETAGGSALEHANSHLGIYPPIILGNPVLASVTAHEIFHAWNVKRLRPLALVPYRYDAAQPTVLLWISEGITDYYADLALVRGGIVPDELFYAITSGKIQQVDEAPPVALEDASLSTWIHPTDGTAYIYYPKGSLAGLLLDILIRDASDNRGSLDGVFAALYRSHGKAGKGFTGADWWQAVSRAAGGRSFADFQERYIDGREPFPWDSVLPLAGLRLQVDSVRQPMLGVSTAPDSLGTRVVSVVPGSAAAAAGVEPGDLLLMVGDIRVTDEDFGPPFRQRYAQADGAELPIVVRRGAETLTLAGRVRLVTQTRPQIVPIPEAPEKAVRIRDGILRGTTTGS